MHICARERWKIIDGYPNYAVSTLGQVMNIKSRRVLKGSTSGRIEPVGERLRRTRMYIHHLVAEAFIPNPKAYRRVVHLDSNRYNNRTDNLQWCELNDCARVPRMDERN